MLLIYCGDGKGKTSASVGQSIRALGQGFRVAFGQFMKSREQAGEQKVLRELLGQDKFFAGGCGFFRQEEEKEKHRAAALKLLDWAFAQVPEVDMLVLDEALYALGYGLINEEELRRLLEDCKSQGKHLVLSGRGLPIWLEQEADLVTEMTLVKHPYDQGVQARKGIEF
jgi:cob(I)alamin adenosyltransferase